MKKFVIATVLIVSAIGISAYSSEKTVNAPVKTEYQINADTKASDEADTISIIRIGRSNLAQAD